MVARERGRLTELLDRDLGRRDVGIAEAEVDHVLPVAPQLELQPLAPGERVRGEGRRPGGTPWRRWSQRLRRGAADCPVQTMLRSRYET